MESIYLKFSDYLDNSKPTSLGIYFSLLLHLSILLFAIGLPDFFKPKEISLPIIIPIEILNVTDVTNLSPIKENNEIEKKVTKKIQQKKFNSSENTEIIKIDIKNKPPKNISKNESIIPEKNSSKEITIKEKKIKKENTEKILVQEKIETIKSKKIKPKLKPKTINIIENKEDIKIEKKDTPKINETKEKVLDKPKPQKKPEPDLTMASIMKDLRNEDTITAANENNDEKDLQEEVQEKNSKNNQPISISERDLVLQQLNSCFNPRAGTIIEGEEFLKISVKIDKLANVMTDTVQIIDTNISKSNPYYEAITESAVATLYNPLCSKLKLPLNKYESWKDLKITIDYSWIKN